MAIDRIPAKTSSPFKSIPEFASRDLNSHEERWFEVLDEIDCINVRTFQADTFTNTVAQGFADLLVRFFDVEFL